MKVGDKVRHRRLGEVGIITEIQHDGNESGETSDDNAIFFVDITTTREESGYASDFEIDSENEIKRDAGEILRRVQGALEVHRGFVSFHAGKIEELGNSNDPLTVGGRSFHEEQLLKFRAVVDTLERIYEFATSPIRKCELRGHELSPQEVECNTCRVLGYLPSKS